MIKCAQYTQLCQSEWISFTVGTQPGVVVQLCVGMFVAKPQSEYFQNRII